MQQSNRVFPLETAIGELLLRPTVTAAITTQTTEYDPSQIYSAPGYHHYLHTEIHTTTGLMGRNQVNIGNPAVHLICLLELFSKGISSWDRMELFTSSVILSHLY